jgi:excisionase family DNA binding protein
MNQKRVKSGEALLLRGDEVAEILRCSRALAYRWMAAGVLPTVRVHGSRSIRVPRAALVKWVEENTQKPTVGAVR